MWKLDPLHTENWGYVETDNQGCCFMPLAESKLRLCSANHRADYFSNLSCDWLSIAWAYSEQESENGPRWYDTLRSLANQIWQEESSSLIIISTLTAIYDINWLSPNHELMSKNKASWICIIFGLKSNNNISHNHDKKASFMVNIHFFVKFHSIIIWQRHYIYILACLSST